MEPSPQFIGWLAIGLLGLGAAIIQGTLVLFFDLDEENALQIGIWSVIALLVMFGLWWWLR